MKNEEIRERILAYLYQRYFNPEGRAQSVQEIELFEPCNISIPNTIGQTLQNTGSVAQLRTNLAFLFEKNLIGAQVSGGFYSAIRIRVEGIEYFEEKTKPWLTKLWESVKKS